MSRQTSTESPKRILILGGGFAGMYAARRLARRFKQSGDVEVTVIARENYLLFTPMLHEVAAGDLDPADIVAPLRRMLRHARLIQGEVTGIDLGARAVRYRVGPLDRPREITYDRLLIALGSEPHFYGMRDVETHAVTMKSLADAALLHTRVVALLEEAAQETDTARRSRLLTFVVVGGGFAGVETAGAVNDFLRDAIRFYPELAPSDARVVLVHSGALLLPELSQSLSRYTMERLASRGVELQLNAHVCGFDGDAVRLVEGGTIPAMSLVWTAGTTPARVLGRLSVEKLKDRLRVNQYLEVVGHEGEVWAVGDCAAVPDGEGVHPPTAQHGTREGLTAARNIEASITGEATSQQVPFSFSTLGQLASIGHRVGVAQVFGLRFSGWTAWWLWRTIYLAKLPGISKKIRVCLKWSLELLFKREIEQLVTLRDLERVERLATTLRATSARTPVAATEPA